MTIKRILITLSLPFMAATGAFALNDTQTVAQVTDGVTVSKDVDYVITGNQPFTTAGSVNITNTDHAVVIIKKVKPSVVIASWLKTHVYINGEQASNGNNCQVKMYASGSIIMPYDRSIKPLTVFSEQNYGGKSVNDFGLENSGGYMNTLTAEKLNNKIRSFKLKRGYMVTFSTRAGGRGYSRCFIADKEDLEISSLPAVLDNKISSYRVFQWYDAQKKGVASDTRAQFVGQVNASWCYSWGTGEALLPDIECVPNHIYEDWPSSAACGSVTYSCHMKTNNEPGNAADDHPQDVATVLGNWENLMRTGMRLCSESSHDGSWNHLRAFIDSIDARGWRCDILDLHCYWNEGAFNNLSNYYSSYGNRPIWISEWVWGASWNRSNWSNGGIFAQAPDGPGSYSQKNQQLNYDHVKPILDKLNANGHIERYAYWNSEADASKIYKDADMSILGKYYAEMESGLAYDRKYEKIPNNPRQYNPSTLVAKYDNEKGKVTLTWHEYNGEYNKSMTVQMKKPGDAAWTTIDAPALQESEADYKMEVDGTDGYKYRVSIVDLNGKTRNSNEASAVNDNVEVGTPVSVGDKKMYVGGNMLLNGDFDLGFLDWTNGEDKPLSAPYYQVMPNGGLDGGSYLQTYGGNDSKTSAQSISRKINLEKGACYYVQVAGCNNNGINERVSTSASEYMESNIQINMPSINTWAKQCSAFKVENDDILLIHLRSLGGKSQFDKMIVSRLFDTKAEAEADALVYTRKRAELLKKYNTSCPEFNNQIDELISNCTSYSQVEAGIKAVLCAIECKKKEQKLLADAATVMEINAPGAAKVKEMVAEMASSVTAECYAEAVGSLETLLEKTLAYTLDKTSIENGSFSSSTGWTVKAGTYKNGDQRLATQAGKPCWNAWWSVPAANGGTMAVKQDVMKLQHGFYALESKGTTQHLCLTDQHAFLVMNGDTLKSPSLSCDVLDIPSFADAQKWETLVTPYIYITETDTITIGFEGSKKGAADKMWHAYANPNNTGDNREGWWCATDFQLRVISALHKSVDASHWGTVCVPYEMTAPENVKLYKLAGITEDQLYICLEETDILESGSPYVFYCEDGDAYFFESGTKITSPKTNVFGLRGIFSTTTQYPLKSMALVNGVWEYKTERTPIENYSGFVYKVEQLAVVKEWAGIKLPTNGLADPTAINGVETVPSATTDTYNVAGQRVKADSKGIVISKGKKISNK